VLTSPTNDSIVTFSVASNFFVSLEKSRATTARRFNHSRLAPPAYVPRARPRAPEPFRDAANVSL
jgi:hypothetical protein